MLLLDPLPILQVRRGTKHKNSAKSMRQPNDRQWARKFIARLRAEGPLTEASIGDSEQPNMPEGRGGAESEKLEYSYPRVFERLSLRSPMMKYESIMSPQYTKEFAAYIGCTNSTAADLGNYLNLDESHPQRNTGARDPLDCLFAIIQSDTLNMLHLMDLALSEIGRHMLNDTFIQHRLVHWRHLLQKFDTELNRLENSLRGFSRFITSSRSGSRDFASIKARTMQCTTEIAHLKQRTERTNKSLMANMSIIESKRAIAEAESITKLTELAFFFIPLTFSASIFGMQVKELNSTEVSLRAFFVLAIAITTSSYALRLIIRSKRVIRRRQNLFKRIREDYHLQPGDPIPTTTFFAWFWGHLGSIKPPILAVVIMSPVLLGVIWTSPLVSGIKAGITLFISIILVIPFVYVTFKGPYARRRMRRST